MASCWDDRNTGKLGDEVIKIAQAMLLCTLPYSATKESHITRTARLGDGSTLTVTFSKGISDVPLPFGSDRKLLAWVFDRAINSESPMIAWESAWEYQKETGLKRSGKNNKDLRERFHRISGLNINIERKDASGIAGKNFSIIDTYHLPPSITGKKFHPDQRSLGYAAEAPEPPAAPFGISINQTLFNDIRKHHVAVPRALWLQAKGNSQVQDMILWLYYRCYSAKTESVVPWSALADQFPQDKNPRRARQHARGSNHPAAAAVAGGKGGSDRDRHLGRQGYRIAAAGRPFQRPSAAPWHVNFPVQSARTGLASM